MQTPPIADNNIHRSEELIAAVRALFFQNKENEERAAELVIAYKKLSFQNGEKEKRAAELAIANEELAFQNTEKEKRAAELVIANEELAFQNGEKEKRAAELVIANEELVFQNREKEKRAAELIVSNDELQKTKMFLDEHVQGLEKMLFMISHRVRQPITHILGLSNLMEQAIDSPEKLKKLTDYIKQSAIALDTLTKELTTFICNFETNEGNNETPKKQKHQD